MNKFKNIRDLLLLSHNENTISDEEFVLLYDCFQSKNPDFSYESYDKFDLDDMGQADCKAEFRIEKADLPRLADVLQIPPVIKCRQRSLCDGLEGLCLLLRRTSYPCRYSDIIPRFPRPVSVLSLISISHLVTDWNRDVLAPAALQTHVEAVSRKGAPLDNCFGL